MPDDPLTLNPNPVSWAEILSPGGLLAQSLEGFEARPQQVEMAESVKRALEEARPLIVEAGTGVGKSLAYLLPCALWAAQNGKRVLVSTFTRALQEQLLEKDLPTVKSALKSLGHDLNYSLLMGSDNYLCVDRLRRAKDAGKEIFEENPPEDLLKTLADWSAKSSTGLRSKLPCRVPAALWDKVSRDPDLCLAKGGPAAEECLYKKDLDRARKAQIVVVNHHLFFSNLGLGPVDALVFDEAHTLEDAASHFLGFSLSDRAMERLLEELYNLETGRGLVRRLASKAPDWAEHLEKIL